MSVHVSAKPERGFRRCGTHFTKTGQSFAADHFSKKQWDILRSEPKLIVSETPETAKTVKDPVPEQLKANLALKIADLLPDDFQNDGKPKLDVLKAALQDQKAKITGALRDEVWGDMVKAGFKAPEPKTPA